MPTAKSLNITTAMYDEALRVRRGKNSPTDCPLTKTAYVSFGLYGLTLYSIANAGRVLRAKYVPEWHKKSLREINDELRRQSWIVEV